MPSFLPLADIYEPSAIQQLPDGRFLVVEDEKQHPFCLFSFAANGQLIVQPVERAAGDSCGKLDDLEGLTLDASGNLYAITSHSRTSEGEEKKSRSKLVRFRIDGNRLVTAGSIGDLRPSLVADYPELTEAAAVLDVKKAGGLNIEAIEITPDTQQLLIGFRSPVPDGKALLACLENPAAAFEGDDPPILAPRLERIDLGGDGFRGLAWIPALNGYLIVSGPAVREQVQFKLWFWSGRSGEAARRVTIPGLAGLEHAEGVCPAVLEGRQQILFVSDDGNREEGRAARYLLLDVAQLGIE